MKMEGKTTLDVSTAMASVAGGWLSTEVVFTLLTQLSGVRIPALQSFYFLKIFILVFFSHYCFDRGQYREIKLLIPGISQMQLAAKGLAK